jgi:ATP-binding cassette subfamily F protein 3
MTLLALDNLKKHYGTQEVLKGASLMLDPGSTLGIVGRNGGGKTTLFRIITGEESPDWGTVALRRGARMGFVPQRPVFAPGLSARDYVESGLDETKLLLARIEAIGEEMGTASGQGLERLMREHDELTGRVDELGGWETERRVETVLSGIGLGEEFWEREACTLSGGEKNRIALARELVADHDLLLLDEPTNHLDLEGIEWLEKYLSEVRGAVLIVSHDRRLLQNSVDRIIELEFGELATYPGNYSRYLVLKQERYDDHLRRYKQQQDHLRKEESFIKKHMGSQRTAEAKGRAKKLTHVERIEAPHHDIRRPVIRAPQAARGGERVLLATGLSGGYEGNVLFKDVELRIGRGQRIGVVGPNGSGKSTLMKILAGRMKALAGSVSLGHGAQVAYYDQNTTHLRDDGTPHSEIGRFHPTLTDLEIRSHLARFLFRGDNVGKSVAALSGGERSRLCLALLVLTKPSWMALDEPTNHLDLASRTALEEMLSEFQGALVCISHDREFLDGLCTHIIEVGDGGVREFEGNYTAWRKVKEAERTAASEARADVAVQAKRAAREKAEAAPKKKKGKNGRSRGGKIRNPYQFERLEKRIIALEEELEVLNAACATEETYSNSEKLRETQIRIAEVSQELELANEDWENWS